ncbi:hypothetical protein IPJ72_02080 [Candidatus Peregrinibacteria bacterium]|nr:MAG: hypothetical protein IPJ72_02080 [Candidatus Peregrinibacteria bacterium]
MFNIFERILWLFSSYTDPQERKVGEFLNAVSHTPSHYQKQQLIALMQTDLVRLNLMLEYRFKGYKKLNKSYRKQCYTNAEKMKALFLKKNMSERRMASNEKLNYLMQIAHFLKPGQYYQYEKNVAFERMLKDPGQSKLIGDCNQIVTFYIYLYSLKFPVTDLKIKLLPDHVCLHFEGKDLEATLGILTEYKNYDFIGSIEEIISTNLLDVPDLKQKRQSVSARNFLRASKLAKAISTHKAITEHNLKIAYQKIVVELLKEKKFSQAREFAKESHETKLVESVMKHEGLEKMNQKKFEAARKLFNKIKFQEGLKACDQNELYEQMEKIKHCKTIKDYRQKLKNLNRIKVLARSIDNTEIIAFTERILSAIKNSKNTN